MPGRGLFHLWCLKRLRRRECRWNQDSAGKWRRASDMISERCGCIVTPRRRHRPRRSKPGPTRSAMKLCWALRRLGRRAGNTLPLLSHELAHVVQQDKVFGGSGQSGLVQRAGLDQPISKQDASGASGLPEPDCDTRVADLFLLGAITCPQQPECCFAQIHDRKEQKPHGHLSRRSSVGGQAGLRVR